LYLTLILGYLKHLNMTFGEKIAMLRKQLKWSQEDLAKKIGTSGPIVGRYERGNITPSIDVVSKIADALEVLVDYLIGKTNLQFDKEAVKRLEDITSLPEPNKHFVLDLIDMALRDFKAKQAYAH
jgi:transcriptional regulator with XRE-family HTH domain